MSQFNVRDATETFLDNEKGEKEDWEKILDRKNVTSPVDTYEDAEKIDRKSPQELLSMNVERFLDDDSNAKFRCAHPGCNKEIDDVWLVYPWEDWWERDTIENTLVNEMLGNI